MVVTSCRIGDLPAASLAKAPQWAGHARTIHCRAGFSVMMIGKPGAPKTSICTADATSIEVRGKDLAAT